MGTWLRFFFGTPQRFVTTSVAIGLVLVVLNPNILNIAVNRMVYALSPLLGPALAICIVFAGIKMILGKK